MRLAADVAAGVVAAGVAYWVASGILPEPSAARVAQGPSSNLGERGHAPDAPSRGGADRAAVRTVAPARTARPDAQPTDPPEDLRAIQRGASMDLLRNEVIRASAEDMGRRHVSVTRCLEGVRLAGAEKIRFVVDVDSTSDQAAIGAWRFVEIADGEPLPEAFAACAARAFGAGQRVVPPPGAHFPDYHGELAMLYTIPAPAGE